MKLYKLQSKFRINSILTIIPKKALKLGIWYKDLINCQKRKAFFYLAQEALICATQVNKTQERDGVLILNWKDAFKKIFTTSDLD